MMPTKPMMPTAQSTAAATARMAASCSRPREHKLSVSDGVFKGLKEGKLVASAFTIAADASDRIVCDNKKGMLYYDADGSGAKEAVHFATASTGLKMTAADFLVV